MQTLRNQVAEVQDRTGKKSKKEIYDIKRHYKLLKTGTLDGIKILRKREVSQEKRSMLLSFRSEYFVFWFSKRDIPIFGK